LTPNFERLARQSVVFGNAHCIATAEEAVMTSGAVFTWLVESADGKAISHFIVPETGARIRID
jgi:thiamine biosynthesis lipoprotein ApbE